MNIRKSRGLRISTIIVSLFSMSLLISCGSIKYSTLEEVINSHKLYISINAEYPPFEYYNAGKIQGFDIDLINEYCKYIKVEPEIDDMDFDAMLLYTFKGKSDCAISAITKNEKREEKFTFSEPYFKSSQVVVVAKNSVYASLTNKNDVLNALSNNKAKIGCQRGTASEYYIIGTDEERMPGIPNTECVPFDTIAMAIKDLNENRLDAVISDDAPIEYILKYYQDLMVIPNISLLDENLCVVFGKNNFSLANSFNEFLTSSKDVISQLKEKYFGGNYE